MALVEQIGGGADGDDGESVEGAGFLKDYLGQNVS